jgi:NitT/TauT family transport system permease protein
MTDRSGYRKWEAYVWPALLCVILLAVWYWCVKWSGTKVFPSPLDVEKGLLELFRKNLLWSYIGDSLRRVAIGFTLAAFAGIPLGLLLGWYPTVNRVVNPTIQFLRPISPIAWIPVAIIFFGVGDRAAIFLIFLAAFFPILVACVSAVASVPGVFRRVGRNFGFNSVQMLRSVILPAALPQIIVGLRLALGIAWLVVVAAEMIAVNSGLGYLVIDSRNAGKRYDLVLAAILLIGIVGLMLDLLFRRLEKLKSVQWGYRAF